MTEALNTFPPFERTKQLLLEGELIDNNTVDHIRLKKLQVNGLVLMVGNEAELGNSPKEIVFWFHTFDGNESNGFIEFGISQNGVLGISAEGIFESDLEVISQQSAEQLIDWAEQTFKSGTINSPALGQHQ